MPLKKEPKTLSEALEQQLRRLDVSIVPAPLRREEADRCLGKALRAQSLSSGSNAPGRAEGAESQNDQVPNGTVVILMDLEDVGKKTINGKEAVIESYDEERKRYIVRTIDSGIKKAVDRRNLKERWCQKADELLLSVEKQGYKREDIVKIVVKLGYRSRNLASVDFLRTLFWHLRFSLLEEDMARDLQKAVRLNGYAGDDDTNPVRERLAGGGEKWTDDIEELLHIVEKLGHRNPILCSEGFLKPFFRHLRLPCLLIREIDEDASKLVRLTYLDVSQNVLTTIEHLPPNLQLLKAYNTRISTIACKQVPSLVFLGLGHSCIGSKGLGQACRLFRNLLSLDLSHSEVASLEDIVTHTQQTPRLKHLCFAGSPVCLLPHYRLKLLHWMKDLLVLDGVPVSDQEASDQDLAKGMVLGRRPQTVRIAFQPLTLTGVRTLLRAVAQDIMDSEDAKKEEGRESECTSPTAEVEDIVIEACGGGALILHFQLPDGRWELSEDVSLEVKDTSGAAAAAQAATTADQADAPEPLDNFDISRLKARNGEPLNFEVSLLQANQADGLQKLCHWVRKGMHLKVCFRPRPPVVEDQGEGGTLSSPSKPSSPQSPTRAPTQSSIPVSPTSSSEPDEDRGPEAPAEVEVGATIVPLDGFLCREGNGIKDEMRQARQLPEEPAPWRRVFSEVKVVPIEDWLRPEVQVPQADISKAALSGAYGASLNVEVTLYAEALAEQSENPSPPATGRASPKSNAKKKT